MDSRLIMEIGFVNDTFQAVDNSPYEEWINNGHFDSDHSHVVLQRLVSVKDGESNYTVDNSIRIADTLNEIKSPFEVKKLENGLYYYQKLVLPTQHHVTSANEKLFYCTTNNKVYYVDSDNENNNITFHNAFNSFQDIYDLVRKGGLDNCFYFDDYAFTIYSLIECYVSIERDRINNFLRNNCQAGCEEYAELEAKASLLLAAIKVIEFLIRKGDFFEAQRILNGLRTCNGLCNKYKHVLKGCGCGRS